MGATKHHPLLAGVNQNGKAWANPAIKRELGVTVYNRVLRHERVFLQQIKKGKDWSKARKAALKAEHKGMTPKERQKYEGRLGALERKLKSGKP